MKKLIGLSKEEVKDISMQIADAFYDYKYNEEDLGLVKYIKSRDDMFTYMNTITQAASKIKRRLEETEMKYGFMAMAMPIVLDKTVYSFLQNYGIEVTSLLKKNIRKEYRGIVKRTPALDKGNSLMSTLYIGCYLVAFHKAAPDIIDEKCFEGLIRCLCDEMMRREKETDSAFSEKNIKSREEAAKRSQTSVCEMDWKSTFRRIDKDNYEFTYSKCGLCELGKREGCFNLIKYLCMTDYISFDKGGAKLIRNHTLANGDEYCDFHVSRKEK